MWCRIRNFGLLSWISLFIRVVDNVRSQFFEDWDGFRVKKKKTQTNLSPVFPHRNLGDLYMSGAERAAHCCSSSLTLPSQEVLVSLFTSVLLRFLAVGLSTTSSALFGGCLCSLLSWMHLFAVPSLLHLPALERKKFLYWVSEGTALLEWRRE